MKYIDEFRNKNLIRGLSNKIRQIMPARRINIMEVCGTHTQNFFRFGLDKIIPQDLRLISGPGCPVCVSTQDYIDTAIKLSRSKDVIILTFGDMLRIPGTRSSLEKERARLGNIAVVYSPLESLKIAKDNPDKKIIFLAVGFETTAPTIALTMLSAKKERLTNLFFLSALKIIPPAMDHLLKGGELNISGFLCPGHVSAVIGAKSYEFIPKRYKIGCCVTGFEPADILEGIYVLLKQVIGNKPSVANQYRRVVNRQGNMRAIKIIDSVFKISDDSWRGLGRIPNSGLRIRDKFACLDAHMQFKIPDKIGRPDSAVTPCRCGEVLKGLISPDECSLFRKKCSPQHPIGPCMVSIEGACNAYYKYH